MSFKSWSLVVVATITITAAAITAMGYGKFRVHQVVQPLPNAAFQGPSVTGVTRDSQGNHPPGEHEHCFQQEIGANDHRDLILTVTPGFPAGTVSTVLINMDPKVEKNESSISTLEVDLPDDSQPQTLDSNGMAVVRFHDAPLGPPAQDSNRKLSNNRIHLGTGPYVAIISATPTATGAKATAGHLFMKYYYETFDKGKGNGNCFNSFSPKGSRTNPKSKSKK